MQRARGTIVSAYHPRTPSGVVYPGSLLYQLYFSVPRGLIYHRATGHNCTKSLTLTQSALSVQCTAYLRYANTLSCSTNYAYTNPTCIGTPEKCSWEILVQGFLKLQGYPCAWAEFFVCIVYCLIVEDYNVGFEIFMENTLTISSCRWTILRISIHKSHLCAKKC